MAPFLTPVFIPASPDAPAYNCPHCGALASFDADDITPYEDGPSIVIQECAACAGYVLWYEGGMVHPAAVQVPALHRDAPAPIREIYLEAASVFNTSHRAAAALARVCLQMLCAELGESGKDINADIGRLVANGLDSDVQKAFDIVRIVGNGAAHPEQIILNDTEADTRSLFSLICFIADHHYHRLAARAAISQQYVKLPPGKLQQIQDRSKIQARSGKQVKNSTASAK